MAGSRRSGKISNDPARSKLLVQHSLPDLGLGHVYRMTRAERYPAGTKRLAAEAARLHASTTVRLDAAEPGGRTVPSTYERGGGSRSVVAREP